MSEITISLDEYIRLMKRDLKLDYLECGGVDNWDGYGYSLNPDYDEDAVSYSDNCIKMEKRLRDRYGK